MDYSFDTSAIVNAWRRYYPPDLFPSLWANLESLIEDESAVATEAVLWELEQKDDEILKWALQRRHFFILVDETLQYAVREILRDFPRLLDNRSNRSGADPFVIALAQVYNLTVVTYERQTNSLQRPNIPDVCDTLNVRCIDVLELVRERGWVL